MTLILDLDLDITKTYQFTEN